MHTMPARELPDRELLHPRVPADRSEDIHT